MDEIGKLKKWADLVPSCELDVPLFIIHRRGGEVVVSAKQAEKSLKKPLSYVGKQFRMEHLDRQLPVMDLVMFRLQKKLEKIPPEQRDKPIMVSLIGDEVSPARRIAEIKKDTELGRELRSMQERYIKWLQKRYREA